MRAEPYRPSFYFLFFCYAAGLLWGLVAELPFPKGWAVGLVCLSVGGVAGLLGGGRPPVRATAAVVLAVACGYANVQLGRMADGRLPEACLDGQKRCYRVELTDYGKETSKCRKHIVRVTAYREASGNWRAARAKLCLYLPKDSAAALLAPGDRLTVYAAPRPFDTASAYAGYARYMARRHVYASAYVARPQWMKAAGNPETFAGFGESGGANVADAGRHPAHRLRRAAGCLQSRLAAGLEHPCIGERERGIAKALILGDRSDMDPDVSQAYRDAGVIHVLCVSGMHLGIVAWVLMALLKGLNGRGGRWSCFGICCLFLWGYALVTGLSASVCRAACMFTFVQAGLCFNRRLPVERTLLMSAWLQLLLRPEWLFDLGFLLSYAAVSGIVFLVPKTYPAVIENRKWIRYIVGMSAVSWAAQCMTSPLSVLCFGRFPVYFWVANLLVAPLATVVLPVGLGVCISSLATGGVAAVCTTGLAVLLQNGLRWMNQISLWIERWPGAVWTLALSAGACLCCYGLLYCGRQAVVRREKRYLPYMGGLLWLMCCLA